MTSTSENVADVSRPSHPDLVKVVRQPGDFTTYALSMVKLAPGAFFTEIVPSRASPAEVSYATVQVSKDQHISLDSDLVYLNHSCDPSLELDTEVMIVRVAKDRALEVSLPRSTH